MIFDGRRDRVYKAFLRAEMSCACACLKPSFLHFGDGAAGDSSCCSIIMSYALKTEPLRMVTTEASPSSKCGDCVEQLLQEEQVLPAESRRRSAGVSASSS
jgi:hypothetical protein